MGGTTTLKKPRLGVKVGETYTQAVHRYLNGRLAAYIDASVMLKLAEDGETNCRLRNLRRACWGLRLTEISEVYDWAPPHSPQPRQWVATGGRGSGRTTAAMLAAPADCVYLVPRGAVQYHRDLAVMLGRADIQIDTPENWLGRRRFHGVNRKTEVDHATQLTDEELVLLRSAEVYSRKKP